MCRWQKEKVFGGGKPTWNREQKIKAGKCVLGECSRTEQMVRSEVSMLRTALGGPGDYGC